MKKKTKRRWINLVFGMCFVLFVFSGCKENEESTENKMKNNVDEVKTKVDGEIEKLFNLCEDNVVITLDEYDYYFYKNNSSSPTFFFDVYSVKELKEQDISVFIDTEIPYTYSVTRQTEEILLESTYMSYLGADWEELYNMMLDDMDRYNEVAAEYTDAYDRIKELPVLYSYWIGVNFQFGNVEFETEIIESIDVMIGEEKYSVENGIITLDADFAIDRGYTGLNLNYLSYGEVPIDINEAGTTVLPVYSFIATEDIRIDDFWVTNPQFSIKNIELEIENNGYFTNEEMEKLSGIEIEAGSNVNIYVTVESEMLKNAFSYGTSGLQVMEYTVLNENIPQTAYCEFAIRTRLRGFDFYGHYIDGINVLDYYYDFYNPIYGY